MAGATQAQVQHWALLRDTCHPGKELFYRGSLNFPFIGSNKLFSKQLSRLYGLIYVCMYFAVLEVESRALHTLSRCSATELCPAP
jgi:hypothetical protein